MTAADLIDPEVIDKAWAVVMGKSMERLDIDLDEMFVRRSVDCDPVEQPEVCG
ncbi:hypothetical protein ACIBEJ_25245 [Nonomuraea sp. NPDC050790]|uniref:hypothetical protein n=1 Tax=Nonomuraea sp. NPDC050790 TaxID=3364371 RepID=UPI0037B2D7E6